MYYIQTLNKISPRGLEVFDMAKYRVGDGVENPDAILVRSTSMHEMQFPPSLRAIARAGAGVNNIPLDRCSEEGIVVFNTPGANANAVKEMVICALLMSARRVFPAMEWVQSLKGQGEAVSQLVEKNKSKFSGPELAGKSLGVIGLGAIGARIANFARHLDMQVWGYDPYMSVETAWNVSRDIHRANSLREIYQNCDFITLHVPSTQETRGMINSQSIAMMRHGVRLLNFARGDLVVDQDLLEGLEERQIRCYFTDFPDDSLLGHPGIMAFPHLGATTPESEENCAHMAAAQLVDYLENGNIRNSVNLPAVSMPRSGENRVAVIHRNIPAMITQVTNAFASAGINIENLTNKSRGDYAYTLVDANGSLGQEALDSIRAINGIIRVTLYR